jgi:prepilin-type N-terminal cleavage/methylation domain-containing protein
MTSSRQSGFSLLELLSVVAVVLILSVMAVAHLLKSRQMAQEAAAISNMRVIADAEATFSALHPELGFVPLSRLGPDGADLVDAELAGGSKQGYNFRVSLKDGNNTFRILVVPRASGRKGFVLDSTGTLQVRECARIREEIAAAK